MNATGGEDSRSDRGERVINGYYRAEEQRLLIIPGRLREFLSTQNMSQQEVLSGWLEMGWLKTQSHHGKRDGTCTARINGHVQRLIALSVEEQHDADVTPIASGGVHASA